MQAVEFGIHCQAGDEKKLVKNVNTFLASVGYRKMYKWVPAGARDPEDPDSVPRYTHYYCQFLKEHPRWYFDLYPNTDLDGKARFPNEAGVGWTLFANKVEPERNSAEDSAKLDNFFSSLAAGTGFPTALLHTYQQGENRI